MSKRVTRVVIAVLISLGLLAAAVPSVQARLGGILQKTESKNAVYMSVDNRALGKSSMKGLDSSPFENGMGSGHDCGSDPTVDY